MRKQDWQRGVTLVEQVIALAVLVILGTAAMMLMGSTERARREAQPAADLVWTRATAGSELALCESAAADLAYFDIAATIASVRTGGGGGSGGGGGPKGGGGGDDGGGKKTAPAAAAPPPSGPPAGYCGPVVLTNPATYPPGFDPRNRTTWSSVQWWSGASSADPSTWYYRCATPPAAGRLAPVYSYGDGVVFAGGDTGVRVPVVGPAAVVPDSVPLYSDQAGDALVLLRTEPSMPRLALGGSFDSASNTIRLVATDPATREAVEGLASGDVLVVTGATPAGATRTALAELRSTPEPLVWPSPLDAAGEPILRYYQASVAPPSSDFRWGLRNPDAGTAGVVIDPDASVAVLDRTGGVVVFYTARGRAGTELVKVTGGVARDAQQLGPVAGDANVRQVLVRGAASALRAEVRTMTVGEGGTARTVAAGLTVAMPIAGESGEPNSEPLSASVAFLASAMTNTKLGFSYGTITDEVSFPGPGVGGGPLVDDEDQGGGGQ